MQCMIYSSQFRVLSSGLLDLKANRSKRSFARLKFLKIQEIFKNNLIKKKLAAGFYNVRLLNDNASSHKVYNLQDFLKQDK